MSLRIIIANIIYLFTHSIIIITSPHSTIQKQMRMIDELREIWFSLALSSYLNESIDWFKWSLTFFFIVLWRQWWNGGKQWARRRGEMSPVLGPTGSLQPLDLLRIFYEKLGTFSESQRITNKCAREKFWDLKMFHRKL